VVVARKALSEDTVAENIQEWGTGALNIDPSRVENNDDGGFCPGGNDDISDDDLYGDSRTGGQKSAEGRYPANVVFDEPTAHDLDQKNENTVSTGGSNPTRESDTWTGKGNLSQGTDASGANTGGLGDSGGVSRYFYTSKATKAERTLDGKIDNAHPTVKPIDLMEWLVTLVTAEGQIVLDPFVGSGTTGVACKNKNREFVGIEQQPQWADVARARVGLTPENPETLREDKDQQGLEQYE